MVLFSFLVKHESTRTYESYLIAACFISSSININSTYPGTHRVLQRSRKLWQRAHCGSLFVLSSPLGGLSAPYMQAKFMCDKYSNVSVLTVQQCTIIVGHILHVKIRVNTSLHDVNPLKGLHLLLLTVLLYLLGFQRFVSACVIRLRCARIIDAVLRFVCFFLENSELLLAPSPSRTSPRIAVRPPPSWRGQTQTNPSAVYSEGSERDYHQ